MTHTTSARVRSALKTSPYFTGQGEMMQERIAAFVTFQHVDAGITYRVAQHPASPAAMVYASYDSGPLAKRLCIELGALNSKIWTQLSLPAAIDYVKELAAARAARAGFADADAIITADLLDPPEDKEQKPVQSYLFFGPPTPVRICQAPDHVPPATWALFKKLATPDEYGWHTTAQFEHWQSTYKPTQDELFGDSIKAALLRAETRGLPALTGSEKQVAWAIQLRDKAFNSASDAPAEIWTLLTSAKFWIDSRHQPAANFNDFVKQLTPHLAKTTKTAAAAIKKLTKQYAPAGR